MVNKESGLNFKPVSNSTGGVLSKLWRTILEDTRMYSAIGFLVSKYVDKSTTLNVKNAKRKTKATLLSNIAAKDMTWSTFNKLIFEFLEVRKMDITIKLTHSGGTESLHSLTVIKEGHKDTENDESK